MLILIDTGQATEVVTATSTGSSTSIPVTPFLLDHGNGVAIGQLLISSALGGVGQAAVPGPAPYGF
jgi:hypothetical protein